ncbi:MAG TPA: hypothetical protein VH279_07495 [Solirubrobacteraceae bacterium]|jgi:hypothetical protein|nr:hypothetical protein [Solirubrobacteraceae bacterium]
MDEGALDMDLLAASLRADSSDVNAFVESLASKLEEAVPDHTRVERRRAGLLGPKQVRRIALDAGSTRLELLRDDGGAVQTRCSRLSGGIVLKTEELGADDWITALGEALAAEAGRNERTRQALERLLIN